jgi:hypothetical protein
MNKAVMFIVGLAVVGAGLYFVLVGTKSAHLELTGNVLKVRTLALGPSATLVVADFRVTNPSGLPFVVGDVEVLLDPASGDRVSGRVVSKQQMDTVFQGLKLMGPKYNDILGVRDSVPAGQTVDRMEAARFERPAAAIDGRKGLTIRIQEVDGAVAEIGEAGKK